jgi:hypothetical protein
MAHITLAGVLLDPTGEFSVGDKVRFTHQSTTGNTMKSAVSVLKVPPNGAYSINLEYGLVLVEYNDYRLGQYRNLGVATVNATNTATSIPELLNAVVPVSSAELIQFQAIQSNCVAAQNAASVSAAAALVSQNAAAASAATLDLINDLSQAYIFDTVAAYQASTTAFPIGKTIHLNDRGADFTIISGQSGTGSVTIPNALISQSITLIVTTPLKISAVGAAPDNGVTDNSPAIQEAYDTGVSEVDFDGNSGEYGYDLTLVIPVTLKKITGTGWPVLRPMSEGVKFVGANGLDNFTVNGIHFKGVSGGAHVSTNQTITIENSTDIHIDSNKFTDTLHRAVLLYGVTDFSMNHNVLKNIGFGLYADGCHDGKIKHNTIDGSAQPDTVFIVGIGLLPIDATYGLNSNIEVMFNTILNLKNSQAILAHGGVEIKVCFNNSKNCSVGLSANRNEVGDDITDFLIQGNIFKGVGVVGYALDQESGITVSATGEASGRIIVSNNILSNFNLKLEGDNSGGIVIIASSGVNMQGNNISDCWGNGVAFSGGASLRAVVKNNSIYNLSGSGAIAGVKVDADVSGEFSGNLITSCVRAYRIQEASVPDLVIESRTERDNTSLSSGTLACVFNGVGAYTDGDSTPSVDHMVTYIAINNTVATDITDLDNYVIGQVVVMTFGDANTTIKSAASGGEFRLVGGADFVSSNRDTLTVTRIGADWLETGRSLN